MSTFPESAPVPIPWRPFIPVVMFSVSHAMTYAVIFPLITDMVTSCGVAADKIGLYAGIAEGAMMLVEVASAPLWARVADRWGRKPALIWGFSVCVFACPLLGFSGSIWQIILWRACLGMNSASTMVNVIAAELSHASNRSVMFSILGPSFYVGMVVGTFLGGELAHPHGRLPAYLGGSAQLWVDYPFALPSVVLGLINILTVIIGLIYLIETLRPSPDTSPHSSRSPYLALLKVPGFVLITTVFFLFQVSQFSWDGLYAIYTYTRPSQGGLGLSVDTIGLLYSGSYLFSSGVDIICLPRMMKRWGSIPAVGIALSAWPILALMIPLTQWTAVHDRMAMWGILVMQLCVRALGAASWGMLDILTMSCFDDYPDLMATGSAISLMGTAGGRAFGPVISGWLFSISTQYPAGSFLRQISWLYIFIVTIPAVLLIRYMWLRERGPSTVGEREALLAVGPGGDGELEEGGTSVKIV